MKMLPQVKKKSPLLAWMEEDLRLESLVVLTESCCRDVTWNLNNAGETVLSHPSNHSPNHTSHFASDCCMFVHVLSCVYIYICMSLQNCVRACTCVCVVCTYLYAAFRVFPIFFSWCVCVRVRANTKGSSHIAQEIHNDRGGKKEEEEERVLGKEREGIPVLCRTGN